MLLEELLEACGLIVPRVNTTVDIDMDSIKREASKFGNDVSKIGVPVSSYTDYILGLKGPVDYNKEDENKKK